MFSINSKIQKVDCHYLDEVIERRYPEGLFLCKSGKYWVAVDNSTGDAWTEEFSTKCQAIFWLLSIKDRLEATFLPFLYSYQLKLAVKIWAIISLPLILSTALFLRSYRIQKFCSKLLK